MPVLILPRHGRVCQADAQLLGAGQLSRCPRMAVTLIVCERSALIAVSCDNGTAYPLRGFLHRSGC